MKCAEAVAVAVEACVEDTKGQTCYICTQALHWKTKEGLVRMCACRGTAGFAHVSCLAEQAKILFAEGGSRVLQGPLHVHCGRMRATQHAPRDPSCVLECLHALAEIVERGAGGRS